MNEELKEKIARRRASHESYQLLSDDDILKEIESEKTLAPERKSLIPAIAENSGRDPEVFLKEIFEWIKILTDKETLWRDLRWEMSKDETLVYLGYFNTEDFYKLKTFPKKYFDRQKGRIKWPPIREMKSGTGMHNLLKKLKGRRVFSLKRCWRESEWWLKVSEENENQPIEPLEAKKFKKPAVIRRRIVKKYYLPVFPKLKKPKKKSKNFKIPPFDLAGNRIILSKDKEIYDYKVGDYFRAKQGSQSLLPFLGSGLLIVVGFTIDNKVVFKPANSNQCLIYPLVFVFNFLEKY